MPPCREFSRCSSLSKIVNCILENSKKYFLSIDVQQLKSIGGILSYNRFTKEDNLSLHILIFEIVPQYVEVKAIRLPFGFLYLLDTIRRGLRFTKYRSPRETFRN